jgi:hypothetical protein
MCPIASLRFPWREDEDVVFLHTGGAPALFACQGVLGIRTEAAAVCAGKNPVLDRL